MAVTKMESRLKDYAGDIIGDIGSKVQALSREEIWFSEKIHNIWSFFMSEYEHEFANLVYRLDPEPEDHMSQVYQLLNSLHPCESQLYLVRQERVSAKISQALIQWDKSKKELKLRAVEGKDIPQQDRQQEAMVNMTGRMLNT